MNKNLKEMLKIALLSVEEREHKAMNTVPLDRAPISSALDEKIISLSRKRQGFFYQATKTMPRRAGFVMAIIVITFALMMSISAIRNPIIKFVVSIYEECVRIEIDDGKIGTHEKIYVAEQIPDGYILLSQSISSSIISTVYLSNDGGLIVLDQHTNHNANISYDNEGEKETYFINGIEVTCVTKSEKNVSMFIWFLEDCYFALYWQNDLSTDKAISLIESLRPVKNQMSIKRNDIEDIYLPTYAPDLKGEASEYIGNDLVETVYISENGEIILSQETGNGNLDITIDIATFKGTLFLGDIQIFYNVGNGCSFYTWAQDGYLFCLECYMEIGTDECLKIIESIEKSKA